MISNRKKKIIKLYLKLALNLNLCLIALLALARTLGWTLVHLIEVGHRMLK